MSDKSNKYGYVGVDIPAQSFGSNKGVFNPAEINDLVANNQWTTFGQLELIETVNITSSTASVDFTSLGNYNVHFLTVNDCRLDVDGRNLVTVLSNNGGTSWITAGYQYAYSWGAGDGVFSESKSTSTSQIPQLTTSGQTGNKLGNSYIYYYNLLDSSKYSFTTSQVIGLDPIGDVQFFFGSAVLPTAETHNAIQLKMSTGTGITKGNFSLYGIRYS